MHAVDFVSCPVAVNRYTGNVGQWRLREQAADLNQLDGLQVLGMQCHDAKAQQAFSSGTRKDGLRRKRGTSGAGETRVSAWAAKSKSHSYLWGLV